MSIPMPGAFKRNVYLDYENHAEKRDIELSSIGWVEEQIEDERNFRRYYDQELDTLKEDRSNKIASSDTYVSDNVHYATTAAVDQRIADISPKQIEWATYGTTTSAQLDEWYRAGKLVLCKNGSGNIFMLTYRQADTVHRFTYIKTYDGTSTTDPKLAYKTMSCVADVWSVRATEQGVETFDNKMKSTDTWVSNETKYPTTKAVENYVAEHAGKDVEWASVNNTTLEQLNTWYNDNKVVLCKYGNKVFRMTKCTSSAAWFSVTYIAGSTGSTINQIRHDAYSVTASGWTNVQGDIELIKNKLASTDTWSSDDGKYPTTASVENYVTRHGEFSGSGSNYRARVWTQDGSSSISSQHELGHVFPYITDFTRPNNSIVQTPSNFFKLKNSNDGTGRYTDLSKIISAAYFCSSPLMRLNGLTKKYGGATNNTAIKVMQAAINDGFHFFANIPGSTTSSGYEFFESYRRIDVDTTDNSIVYVESPKIIHSENDTQYDAMWYNKALNGGLWVSDIDIYEDGTTSTVTGSYRIRPGIALRHWANGSNPGISNELVFEACWILVGKNGTEAWHHRIIHGAARTTNCSGPDGASYGFVFSNSFHCPPTGNVLRYALLVKNNLSTDSSVGRYQLSGAWGVKISNSEYNNTNTTVAEAITSGIAASDKFVDYGDLYVDWQPGAAWRRWTKSALSRGDDEYPWGDILTTNCPSSGGWSLTSVPWQQFGNLGTDTSAHPGGWFTSRQVTESCWSPHPGWFRFEGSATMLRQSSGADSSATLLTTEFKQTFVWKHQRFHTRYPSSDSKFFHSYGIRLKDMTQVNVWVNHPNMSSTYYKGVYVDKGWYENATSSQKAAWKFTIDNYTYQLYPAFVVDGLGFQPCLVVFAEDSEQGWTKGANFDTDYPWHLFMFNGGFLKNSSSDVGLIQTATSTNALAPVPCVWALWGTPGSSVASFWTDPHQFMLMDCNRDTIIGDKHGYYSAGTYGIPAVYKSWFPKYVEASLPRNKQKISQLQAHSFHTNFSEDVHDYEAKSVSTGTNELYGVPNHVNYTQKKASSYYIDPDTKELVFGTWDFDKSAASAYATKTEERIALGGVEWATYGSTTNAQLLQWTQSNKIVLLKYDNVIYRMTRYYSATAVFSVACPTTWSGATPLKLSDLLITVKGDVWSSSMDLVVKADDPWDSSDVKYSTTAAIDARIVSVLQSYGLIP